MMNTRKLPDVARFVDLARYPVNDIRSEHAAALVRGWREQLDQTGACNLQGFLTPAGIDALAAEAETMLAHAYRRTFTANFRYI